GRLRDLCGMSALPPRATVELTLLDVSKVPQADFVACFNYGTSLGCGFAPWRPNHKGPRQFARTFDEAFGGGAEGAVLQGNNDDKLRRHRQLDRQRFKTENLTLEVQGRGGQYSDEAASHAQTIAQLHGQRFHGHARRGQTACSESLHDRQLAGRS